MGERPVLPLENGDNIGFYKLCVVLHSCITAYHSVSFVWVASHVELLISRLKVAGI